MPRIIITVFCSLLLSPLCFSQNKLVIDDRAGILSDGNEAFLSGKMEARGIDYTHSVDIREACNYHFASLNLSGKDLILRIKDCDNTELGAKNLGAAIISASAEEQGIMLGLAISDILNEPGEYFIAGKGGSSQTASQDETISASELLSDSVMSNEHDSRYFFAPSAYNLKKGELYYNTLYFFIHDMQYGISNNFSLGMGTTIIGLPLYITPKISIPLGGKSALAFGDLLMLGTYGTDFIGNLAYGVYTYGGINGNISIGAGHLWTNENEITNQSSSAVLNISGLGRLAPYMFFLTENYLMSANFSREAWRIDGTSSYDDFEQRNTFWYGIMGIRIVSKNRSFVAWHVGLSYIINFSGDIPREFDNPDWNHDGREPGDMNLIAFPTVAFTLKFGKKY